MSIRIKTEKEIEVMAEGGHILARIMNKLIEKSKAGITTQELDEVANNLILSHGGKPSFKGHNGFPATICASINNELVHCAPSERKLKEGDIFSIDIGMKYKGYHTDMAVTIPIGEVDQEAMRLIRITKKALKRGIKKSRIGNTFGDVGNTIQRYVEDQGFEAIRDLCGHGIGKDLHEDPQIMNYGRRKTGPEIKKGMVFCLEPMVAMGDWNIEKSSDGHGFKTKKLSAHFEHTIAISKNGLKVLTLL